MVLIEIVTLLAVLQFVVFSALVSRARGKFGVRAPAVSGHEMFERYYRVQMNTLELLVAFLPSLWLAARHWSPLVVSGIGAVYLVGRIVYLRAYLYDPKTRSAGFLLSFVPAVVLLVAALVGAVLAGLK
jgi:glutathione S-transferase